MGLGGSGPEDGVLEAVGCQDSLGVMSGRWLSSLEPLGLLREAGVTEPCRGCSSSDRAWCGRAKARGWSQGFSVPSPEGKPRQLLWWGGCFCRGSMVSVSHSLFGSLSSPSLRILGCHE